MKKKNLILMIIAIVTLLSFVIFATYAYYSSTSNIGNLANVNASSERNNMAFVTTGEANSINIICHAGSVRCSVYIAGTLYCQDDNERLRCRLYNSSADCYTY